MKNDVEIRIIDASVFQVLHSVGVGATTLLSVTGRKLFLHTFSLSSIPVI